MIERVIGVTEELAVEAAAIESGIVFAGDALDQRNVDPLRNFLKLLHALGVNVFVLGVVSEIAGKKDKVWPLWQGVDHFDGALERLGAKGIGRAIEADVGVAQLDERKRRNFLAAGPAERGKHVADLAFGKGSRIGGVQHSDAERGAGNFEKRPAI